MWTRKYVAILYMNSTTVNVPRILSSFLEKDQRGADLIARYRCLCLRHDQRTVRSDCIPVATEQEALTRPVAAQREEHNSL